MNQVILSEVLLYILLFYFTLFYYLLSLEILIFKIIKYIFKKIGLWMLSTIDFIKFLDIHHP